MRYIIYVFILLCNLIQAQQLRIGLFRASELKKLSMLNSAGELSLQADFFQFTFFENQDFTISAVGNDLIIDAGIQRLGKFRKLKFDPLNKQVIKIDCINPDLKELTYTGAFEITSVKGEIKLINITDESNYLCGVLKGESGINKPKSFYDAMAVVSRTYMKFYDGRHAKEGFSICDQTHCQVYKGYSFYQPWLDAVMTTDGIVLKNPDLNGYAEAVFHSNCGGMTASAKTVWKNDISVCEVTMDSFCINGKHAIWEKTISMDHFNSTIGISKDMANHDSLCRFIEFCHTGERPQEFKFGNLVVSAVKMRSMFLLRSAWFDVECLTDSVLFSGKGYGHGVGMCQEGAIEMAKQNKDFITILKYYFKRVAIVNEKFNTILYRRDVTAEL